MSHWWIAYYAAAAAVGLIAVSFSSLGIIRSRVPAYWYLLAFYIGFTTVTASVLVREYLVLNVENVTTTAVFRTYEVAAALEPLYLGALALFLHRANASKPTLGQDIAVGSLTTTTVVLRFLPGAVALDGAAGSLALNAPFRISLILYAVLFAYVLACTASGIRRTKPVRELILLAALLVFGVIGFAESMFRLGTTIQGGSIALPGAASSAAGTQPDGRFLISTVPFLAFSGVMLVFFGGFLAADSRPSNGIDTSFVQRYGITPREAEVAELMNRGLSNREIAEKLFVSVGTVKTHAHNIYEKTGASSRYDLYAMMRG